MIYLIHVHAFRFCTGFFLVDFPFQLNVDGEYPIEYCDRRMNKNVCGCLDHYSFEMSDETLDENCSDYNLFCERQSTEIR